VELVPDDRGGRLWNAHNHTTAEAGQHIFGDPSVANRMRTPATRLQGIGGTATRPPERINSTSLPAASEQEHWALERLGIGVYLVHEDCRVERLLDLAGPGT